MTTVNWNFPTRIVYGAGAAGQCGAEAKALSGSRALVVTDPGVRKAGVVEPVQESLTAADIDFEVFDAITSNPTEAEVEAGTEVYKRSGADIVVAVGGGSALDVGKLLRITANHPLPLDVYDDQKGGSEHIDKPLPPMLAVPTTAGTGSEVGRSAVATLAATNRKTVFFSPRLIPSVAVLDPLLTLSMPAQITACTGFDALTHCIEAYSTKMEHPMAEAIAEKGITLVQEYLERAVQDGSDVEARGALLKAALMGAVAFQKGLGACHSLAHPLSAEEGMHHGLANALCLPAVLDFNRSEVPGKLARIAKLLGVRAQDEESLAFECSGAVRALRAKLGLPKGLEAAGVDEEQLEKLADLAFEDVCHQENPRPCTREDLLALYRSSY